jgi:MFS family permease
LNWPELPALRSADFRLWLIGQGLSYLGTWMTNLPIVWLVYHLTGSPLILGVVSFCAQAPIVFLSFLGGSLADRYPRRRILLITQSLSMLISFTLAALALTGIISFRELVVLAMFQGIVSAFDIPASFSFGPDLLQDPESVANGEALFASLFSITGFIGPALAGILVAAAEPGVCFLIDGLSYLAALAALVLIHPPPQKLSSTGKPQKTWQQVREGFVYAYGSSTVRSLLLLVSFVALLTASSVLLPVVAKDVLGGGAPALGLITSCTALGAVLASFYLNLQSHPSELRRATIVALPLLGISLLLLGSSRWLGLSLLASAGVGCGGLLATVSSNTLLQTLTETDKRGRVVSLFTMSALGMSALGGLLFGTLAHHVGVFIVYLICGGLRPPPGHCKQN